MSNNNPFDGNQRRNVEDFLQGRANLFVWGALIVLGVAFIVFAIQGML